MPLAFRYFTAGSLACHAAAFLPVANRSLHCALQTFQIKDFGVFPKIWPRNPLSHFRTWKTANWGIPDCWTHHSSTAGSNAVETRHLNANQVPLEPRERLRGESTWTWQDKYDNDKFSKKTYGKEKILPCTNQVPVALRFEQIGTPSSASSECPGVAGAGSSHRLTWNRLKIFKTCRAGTHSVQWGLGLKGLGFYSSDSFQNIDMLC